MAHVPKTPPPNRRRNNRQPVVSTNTTNHIHQPQAVHQSISNQNLNVEPQRLHHQRAATSPPQTPTRHGFSPAQPFQPNGGIMQASNGMEGATSDSVTSTTKKKKSRRTRKPKNGDHVLPSTEDARTGANMNSASKPQEDTSATRPVSMSESAQAPAATPAKTFYAGPTFHASPAASKLPMPKFSKSVPAEPTQSGLQARLDRESSDRSTSPSSSGTETPTTPSVPERREESPLDFLLNAHRDEQIRNSSQARATPPQHAGNHHMRAASQGSGMFAFELDGSNGRTPPLVANPHHLPQSNPSAQALKERLFQYQKASPLPTPPPSSAKGSPGPSSLNHSPSPVGRPIGVQTPQRPESEQAKFYYGNRNLSPLFQASTVDPNKPRSGLRQEFVGGPVLPPATELPNSHSPTSATPTRQSFGHNGNRIPQPQPQPTFMKENFRFGPPNQPDFRRAYSSNSPNGNANGHSNMFPVPGTLQPPAQPTRHVSDQSVPTAPTNDSSNDIKSMEDNLRRMLNLGARGPNVSGVQQFA